jgi:hypothetical protein
VQRRFRVREGLRGLDLHPSVRGSHARACPAMVQHGDLREPGEAGGPPRSPEASPVNQSSDTAPGIRKEIVNACIRQRRHARSDGRAEGFDGIFKGPVRRECRCALNIDGDGRARTWPSRRTGRRSTPTRASITDPGRGVSATSCRRVTSERT